MHYYIASYTGDGSNANPFRPNTDVEGWAAVDLRPDPTQQAGRCVLALPVRVDPPNSRYVGEEPDLQLGLVARNALGNDLGVTLSATRFRTIVAELLIDHARLDGTRWKPLRSTAQGLYQIWLGNLFFEMPVIAGGATITESFNKADSDTLGPDLTWTEVSGDYDIVSNRASLQSVDNLRHMARAEHDLLNSNHYAQAKVWGTAPASGDSWGGPAVRVGSTGTSPDCYCSALVRLAAGNEQWLFKISATTLTFIASTVSEAWTNGDTCKVSVTGSTVKSYRNGTEKQSATDTSIVGSVRTGVFGNIDTTGSAGDTQFDDFEASDGSAINLNLVGGRSAARTGWGP